VAIKKRKKASAKKKTKHPGIVHLKKGVLGRIAKSEDPHTASKAGYAIILKRAPVILKVGGGDKKLTDAFVSAYATGAITYQGKEVQGKEPTLVRGGYSKKAVGARRHKAPLGMAKFRRKK
jgi:hypothetical protein